MAGGKHTIQTVITFILKGLSRMFDTQQFTPIKQFNTGFRWPLVGDTNQRKATIVKLFKMTVKAYFNTQPMVHNSCLGVPKKLFPDSNISRLSLFHITVLQK